MKSEYVEIQKMISIPSHLIPRDNGGQRHLNSLHSAAYGNILY